LTVAIDKATKKGTFECNSVATTHLEKLKKFLKKVEITKNSGCLWKGRDVDSL